MKIENVIFIMGVLQGKHDRDGWFIFFGIVVGKYRRKVRYHDRIIASYA